MSKWVPAVTFDSSTRYRAIAEAIEAAVAAGELSENEKLLPHRDMAWRLGVTPGTVARAYKLCEERGLLTARVGHGTRVAAKGSIEIATIEGGSHYVDLGLLIAAPVGGATLIKKAFVDTLRDVAEAFPGEALHGPAPEFGLPAHREAGAQFVSRLGVPCNPNELIITRGAQEAFMILLHRETEPGDVVLTEEISYFAFKHLCAVLNRRLEPVRTDEEGIIPDALSEAQRKWGAKLLYTCPTAHNPTGTVVPIKRRRAIVRKVRELDMKVIEDNPFGALFSDPPPPLAVLAPERVVHVASLTKYVRNIRLAYLKAPLEDVRDLETVKHTLTVSGSFLRADLVTRWMKEGTFEQLLSAQRREIEARWATARDILGENTVVSRPLQFLWMEVPSPWRVADFVLAVRKEGIRCVDGDQFTVGRTGNPRRVRIALTAPETDRALRDALGKIRRILDSKISSLGMIY